jgi:ribosomal protein L11 methyltransferase
VDYLELKIDVSSEEHRDILLCRLLGEGFESFVETENILMAYIPSHLLIKEKIEPILDGFHVTYKFSLVHHQNWNEEWEKHYDPVLLRNQCYIRAPFHDPMPGVQYEIIIEPKMSFGTAHHETTSMMIELMLETEFTDRKVLDMGCGTGILAILAEKSGAVDIVAVDNDEWSYENAIENIRKNNANSIHVVLGDVKTIDDTGFDLILANINRNILHEQIDDYSRLMVRGDLIMSGFYEDDIPIIRDKAEKNGFQFLTHLTRNKWAAVKFRK